MTCSQCGAEKVRWGFETFRTRKGVLHRRGVCKTCRGKRAQKRFRYYQAYRRKYNKKNRTRKQVRDQVRRTEIRAYVNAVKAGAPCADCGQQFPPVCMDFDHVREKVRSVANLVGGAYRLELIKEEIARCEIVCANCHRVRTHSRNQHVAPKRALGEVRSR